MAAERRKLIVVPIDGSENSLRSLNYVNLMFGPKQNLKVTVQKAKEMLLEAGLREGQITTKLVDGSRSAAAEILEEMKSSKAGFLFIGLHGYSNVADFAMGSVTRKVLTQAEDLAVCMV